MRHRISGGLIPKAILATVCALVFACAQVPVAFAQRGGGGHVSAPHMAAPAARPSAPPHVAPPPRPAAAPQVRPPVVRPMPSTPPPAGFGTPGFRTRRPLPVRPGPPFRPPVRFPVFAPIFVSPIFPPFGFGFGFGFNSFWPSYCGPALFWNFGCGVGPGYVDGLGYYGAYTGPSYPYESEPYQGPASPAPLYVYGGAERDLVELYMKDGTVYSVLDYWVVDNQLHFTTNDGGETPAEHVVSLDDLDMQKTIDVNTQRGFNFTLRNEPIDQYLQDHPDVGSPNSGAPDAAPQDQSPAAPQDQTPTQEAVPQAQPAPQSPNQPPPQ